MLTPSISCCQAYSCLHRLYIWKMFETFLNSVIINGQEEWKVEKILDSCWHHKKYQYLIKWKGFGLEENFWKNVSEVSTLDKVAEFYCINSQALRLIQAVNFKSIKFWSIPLTLNHSNLRGGGYKRMTNTKLWTFDSRVYKAWYLIQDYGVLSYPLKYYYCLTPIPTSTSLNTIL